MVSTMSSLRPGSEKVRSVVVPLLVAFVALGGAVFVGHPACAATLPLPDVLREPAQLPPDSSRARQTMLREHDAEFRIAFDSLLAASPRWRTKSGLDLDRLAPAHWSATHDSMLLRDLRAVRGMPAPMRGVWWRGVRAEAGGRKLYASNNFVVSADSFGVAAEAYVKSGDLRREAIIL